VPPIWLGKRSEHITIADANIIITDFGEAWFPAGSTRRAAARIGWMKCLAARSSPWLARLTEQGEPPWLTPGSPSRLKRPEPWPEPTAQAYTILAGIYTSQRAYTLPPDLPGVSGCLMRGTHCDVSLLAHPRTSGLGEREPPNRSLSLLALVWTYRAVRQSWFRLGRSEPPRPLDSPDQHCAQRNTIASPTALPLKDSIVQVSFNQEEQKEWKRMLPIQTPTSASPALTCMERQPYQPT
jgi:hypothetical protein